MVVKSRTETCSLHQLPQDPLHFGQTEHLRHEFFNQVGLGLQHGIQKSLRLLPRQQLVGVLLDHCSRVPG